MFLVTLFFISHNLAELISRLLLNDLAETFLDKHSKLICLIEMNEEQDREGVMERTD